MRKIEKSLDALIEQSGIFIIALMVVLGGFHLIVVAIIKIPLAISHWYSIVIP